MTITAKHQILIVGGGTAGITVAARMLRKGYTDVAVIEPSSTHYYQPLWTLVGGGQAKASTTERSEASVMPKQATWIKNAASGRRPGQQHGHLRRRGDLRLRRARGLPRHPARLEPHRGTRGRPRPATGCRRTTGSTSRRAPGTSSATLRSGTAVFTMPSGPIKCAGAPQKIAYLAADYWRKQGVLNDIDVHLVVPTPRLFGIPAIADSLDKVIADYGITVHTNSEVTSVDAASHKVGGHQRRRRAGPTPCCPTTCCTPCRASRRRTGSSPARCRPATQTATSTSTSTPCSTCATRTCSASATPARHRTRRPAPRSASRPPSSSTTSTRS